MFSIRKLGAIGRTYRHLNRYHRILRVLFKYGFNDLSTGCTSTSTWSRACR